MRKSQEGRKVRSAGGRHFVYVMTCLSDARIIAKVGLSNHPEKRLQQIQATSPLRITGFYTAEVSHRWRAFAAEQEIHAKLVKFRAHGEWFVFGSGTVDELFRAVDEVIGPYGAVLEKSRAIASGTV